MLQSLRRFVPGRKAMLPAGGETHRPLLDEDELDEIIRQVHALEAASHPQDVHYRQAGNFRSVYLGRGLDFEEVRQYQHGDEIRDMDWRTTARTGKPYLKIYREEHQPALHILVDRSASMRFGTRRQLKATLAARLAALFAFSAMTDNTCIGGTLWQPGGFSLPCRNGEEGAMQLVEAAIAPCPPLPEEAQQVRTFSAMLRSLDMQLQRGSKLVLLSDFSQLHEQDLPVLMSLAAHHQLIAVGIADAVENELPNVGMMRFYDLTSRRVRWLDSASRKVREGFASQAAQQHDRQRALFERIGIKLHRCRTDENAFELFRSLHAQH